MARRAYISIGLAVKTGRPQFVTSSGHAKAWLYPEVDVSLKTCKVLRETKIPFKILSLHHKLYNKFRTDCYIVSFYIDK